MNIVFIYYHFKFNGASNGAKLSNACGSGSFLYTTVLESKDRKEINGNCSRL